MSVNQLLHTRHVENEFTESDQYFNNLFDIKSKNTKKPCQFKNIIYYDMKEEKAARVQLHHRLTNIPHAIVLVICEHPSSIATWIIQFIFNVLR